MKSLVYLFVLVFFATLGFGDKVQAQETESGYNPNSVYPIHEEFIMYKKRLWRRMDLKEKQNLPFFAFNNEITKIMIEAVRNGTLQSYANDSLTTMMTKEEFLKQMELPDYGGGLSEDEKALGFGDEEEADGDSWGDEEEVVDEGESNYFLPNEISILEIMEDMLFDRKHSRLKFDIQSVKMVIPADKFETGLIREVAVFKYKDLQVLFKSMPDKAVWFNPYNTSEHRNLADAFDLRMFSARIIKFSNPKDEMIVDIYNQSPKAGIIASMQYEADLLEWEHNLWEF